MSFLIYSIFPCCHWSSSSISRGIIYSLFWPSVFFGSHHVFIPDELSPLYLIQCSVDPSYYSSYHIVLIMFHALFKKSIPIASIFFCFFAVISQHSDPYVKISLLSTGRLSPRYLILFCSSEMRIRIHFCPYVFDAICPCWMFLL